MDQSLFQSVVESSPNAIVMVNRAGTVVLFNEQAERLFGYRRDEIIGEPVERLLPEALRRAHSEYREGFNKDPHRRAMGAGRDLVGMRKDGSTVPIEIGLNPVHTADGPHILASIIDITERKNAEQERIALQRQVLEASERERRRIGQDLHDDLGQKLLGIGLLTKVLKEDLKDVDPARAQEADRVLGLVNEALAQTRQLARGLYAAELEANDLPTALRQLVTNTQHLLRGECSFQCDVSPRSYAPDVSSNFYRIAQEALNNALKHSQATKITVILSETPGHLRLAIEDNGKGLPSVAGEDGGMGLQVMAYRANIIGATFSVERMNGGGTAVVCSIPKEKT